MGQFSWVLNSLSENINTKSGDVIPVYVHFRYVGNCKISIETGNIIGNFVLREDLQNDEDLVLYLISAPFEKNELWLEGISIVPADDRLKNRPRTVREMNDQHSA